MSPACCSKLVTSGGISSTNLPASWMGEVRYAVEAEHARVRPSIWCVGATIHEQALSSEVCGWAGGVGWSPGNTSSLMSGRRLGATVSPSKQRQRSSVLTSSLATTSPPRSRQVLQVGRWSSLDPPGGSDDICGARRCADRRRLESVTSKARGRGSRTRH